MNRVRKALDCPGEAREDWRIVCDLAHALGASWPEYASPEDVWNELADLSPELVRDPLRRGSRSTGSSGRAPTSTTRGRRICTRRGRRCRAGAGGSSRSSTSRRSSSPTRSTRSC